MKKLIAVLAYTMPLVFAPTLYAQDSTTDTTTTDPAADSNGAASSTENGTSASDIPSTGQGTGGTTGEGSAGDAATDTAPADDTAPAAPPADTPPGAMPGAAAPGAEGPPPMGDESAATEEPAQAISGVSIKKSIMGKSVYNEGDEKIGDVSDVVLSSEGQAAYFIVGAGGFLGMGEHSVAIPYDEIQQSGDKMILPGYTKDQLKALPKVEVAE